MDPMDEARRLCREVDALEQRIAQLRIARRNALQKLTKDYTQREIATAIGISQPRVCQLLK